MLAHTTSTELVNLRDEAIEELAVVRDKDGGAVKGADSLLQHILRLHVEMVRRLVEDEQIDGFQQQANHCQSAALATREHFHFLLRLLAAKHEGTQNVVDAQTDVASSHAVDSIEDCQALVEQLCLVLCEIAYLHVVPYLQIPVERNLVHDALHQCRFSLAVLSHEGHFLAALDGEVHVVEDQMRALVAIHFLHLVANHRIVARAQAWRKFQVHGRVVGLVDLYGHYLLQLLYLLLHLHRLCGLVAESLYEVFHLGHFLLLVLVCPELLLAPLFSQCHIFVVFHAVVDDLSARNLQRAVRHIVDKRTVMTDEHHCSAPRCQQLLQPLYALYVEVVGRLVEQQHVGPLQQNLRQFYSHAPSS